MKIRALGANGIELYLDTLAASFLEVKKMTKARICAVVKAHAYGWGMVVPSLLLEQLGVDLLAVSHVEEGRTLRLAGIKTPILLLTPLLKEEVQEALGLHLLCTVSRPEHLLALKEGARHAKRIPIHLKVDTGMHRLGVTLKEAENIMETLDTSTFLLLGIYTHFSSARKNPTFTKKQFQRFLQLRERLKNRDHYLWHCANSAAFQRFPATDLDLIRLGTRLFCGTQANPRLQLYSHIIQVKDVEKGAKVGYEGTFTTKRKSTLGVIPLGYSHGLALNPTPTGLRAVKNSILALRKKSPTVRIQQVECPLRGLVGMNMSIVDLTHHPKKQSLHGAKVLLHARQSTLSPLLPRIYLWEGVPRIILWQEKLYLIQGQEANLPLCNLTPFALRERVFFGSAREKPLWVP